MYFLLSFDYKYIMQYAEIGIMETLSHAMLQIVFYWFKWVPFPYGGLYYVWMRA